MRLVLARDFDVSVTKDPEESSLIRGLGADNDAGHDLLGGGLDAVLRLPVQDVDAADKMTRQCRSGLRH